MEQLIQSARPLVVHRSLCTSCFRLRSESSPRYSRLRIGLQNSDRIQRRFKGYIAPEGEQAKPIEGFYKDMLSKPLSQVQSATHTPPEPPPADELPKTQKEETLAKARVVFGSRLAGPAERKAQLDAASENVAGVVVPPKPTEPDNCCMSGCVNCVWDLYRDEMEDWAAKATQARAALQAKREDGKATGTATSAEGTPTHVATSMDDDGGGSETNWGSDVGAADLFEDIPVGIREFMKTEKKLRQRHKEEAAAAA